MRWAPLFMAATVSAVLLYQLASGVVLNGRWRVWYRRSDEPKGYWTILLTQAGLTLLILALWGYKVFSNR